MIRVIMLLKFVVADSMEESKIWIAGCFERNLRCRFTSTSSPTLASRKMSVIGFLSSATNPRVDYVLTLSSLHRCHKNGTI